MERLLVVSAIEESRLVVCHFRKWSLLRLFLAAASILIVFAESLDISPRTLRVLNITHSS